MVNSRTYLAHFGLVLIENLGYVMKMDQQVNPNELDKVSRMIRDV